MTSNITDFNPSEYSQEKFKELYEQNFTPEQKCLHKSCPDCRGTGIKRNGDVCIHGISCTCPKCTIR